MPTPCGLGLKFTVGTAVSVPPLGLLGGSSGSAGATAQGPPEEEEEEEERETRGRLIFYLYIRDISNKNLNIVSPTFLRGNGTRRIMTQNTSFYVACLAR